MYKLISLNLQFRMKRYDTEHPMDTKPVANKIVHVQREREEGHKTCELTDGFPIPKPRRYLFSTSLFPSILKLIPEHPMALISKYTTWNNACQTHRAYNPYWPEIHMEPTKYFIAPHKRIRNRNITLTELTTTQTNDKTTQTVQTNDSQQ